MIREDLSNVDGCSKSGITETVYGIPWKSMLTLGGAVVSRCYLRRCLGLHGVLLPIGELQLKLIQYRSTKHRPRSFVQELRFLRRLRSFAAPLDEAILDRFHLSVAQ
jgi:hypothetical protein